ncbi:isocitrate lyase/phosphoenolpyruvate mutase family protein [Luteimonas viscosa]|uniref:Isocitrate lyase/phosphoenolpyruvate mutase family protein n=1 Tax=Luteimonas viscosa TaxID=1132694 RepID=A0A5D4XP74_9GAMM|nr:isocitrate lyase/phosphoenolpyruvate mutase family protein [Luteimonas viscosa]TYT25581.1 isocitrate lyase/phosphoenolpyruvate mutase family protein [Luteimonas viscosa]
MGTQVDKAVLFRSLHAGAQPLVLYNAWDPGSARAVAESGAHAIATGSWSVAAAHGYADGERMPLALALDNLARIVAATTLPVTVDLEGGYGETAEEVGVTVARSIEAGAVGCNLEDSHPAGGGLRGIADQAARLAQARAAAETAGVPLFVNARTDVFLQSPPDAHDAAMVERALERARAYAEAGANGLFVPGLADDALIAMLVQASPLPVNVMAGPGTPSLSRLAALRVARVSHGPGPYLAAMGALAQAARQAAAIDA